MTDVRVRKFDLTASAGMTTRFDGLSDTAITSFSWYTGGTFGASGRDVDDLTSATEHPGNVTGGTAIEVDLVCPTGSQQVALRTVVDGAVVTVGTLTPSLNGSALSSTDFTMQTVEHTFTMSVLGVIVEGEAGPGGEVDVVSNVATSRILGRITAGTGDSEELTAAQARTLLNVEDGATADQTPAQILAGLLGVDGAGSLLDADLLDGQQATAFATAAQGTAADAAKTKTDFLTVTQPVDLDTIETRVNALDAAVVLKGSWDASAGTFPGGGTAQAGDSYIVSVAGTVDSVAFVANDRILAIVDNAATGTYAANWLKLDYTDQVLSVAGQTGAVTLAKGDVGLGNVDNTSDANKPVSTAQQTALDLKANLASPSGSGVATWPAFSASGLTGAVAGARFVGCTASGPPATGTFLLADYVIDQTGQMWICTVAGSPGTWLPPGSGRELGYASITSSPAGVSVTGVANRIDVTGLSIDFTVGSRPVMVVGKFGQVSNDTADRGAGMAIVDGTTVLDHSIGTSPVSGGIFNLYSEARIAAGAGAKTVKIMVFATIAGTATFSCTATRPGSIRAVEV